MKTRTARSLPQHQKAPDFSRGMDGLFGLSVRGFASTIPQYHTVWGRRYRAGASDIAKKPPAFLRQAQAFGSEAQSRRDGEGIRLSSAEVQSRTIAGGGSPLVSVIILSTGDSQMTIKCIDALERYTAYDAYEVLVVDNGSPPTQRMRLRRSLKLHPRLKLRLVPHRENLGYARANNQAAALAKGEILVFLNNDVIVTDGWLQPLVRFMLRHNRAAACQPKFRSAVLREYFDYAGGAGGFLDMFGYPFTRGRIFDSIEKDIGQYDSTTEVTWASGACFVVTASAFREAGGFDEYFFAYMEEIDLCLRLRQQGYRIYCLPTSTVFHYGAYTSNRNLPRKIFMNHRNNLYLVLKHYSLWPNVPIIAIRLAFDVFSALHYLFEFKFAFIGSVVRAHLSLMRSLPQMVRQKVLTLRGKSLLDNETVYRGSIVLDYFLRGKEDYARIHGAQRQTPSSYKRYVDVTYFRSAHARPTPSPTRT